MARTGRRPSLATLESKIQKQEEALAKSKAKYEADKEELAKMLKLRDQLRKDELMEAVIKSDRSYDEILQYVKGTDH